MVHLIRNFKRHTYLTHARMIQKTSTITHRRRHEPHTQCRVRCVVIKVLVSIFSHKMQVGYNHDIALPRLLLAPNLLPDFIFCASPTISPISLLYVSESCCRASLVCRRYVRSTDVWAVCCFSVCRWSSTFLRGKSDRSSVAIGV